MCLCLGNWMCNRPKPLCGPILTSEGSSLLCWSQRQRPSLISPTSCYQVKGNQKSEIYLFVRCTYETVHAALTCVEFSTTIWADTGGCIIWWRTWAWMIDQHMSWIPECEWNVMMKLVRHVLYDVTGACAKKTCLNKLWKFSFPSVKKVNMHV